MIVIVTGGKQSQILLRRLRTIHTTSFLVVSLCAWSVWSAWVAWSAWSAWSARRGIFFIIVNEVNIK